MKKILLLALTVSFGLMAMAQQPAAKKATPRSLSLLLAPPYNRKETAAFMFQAMSLNMDRTM